MRHRITSFRCVEAETNVSLREMKRKTCNAVNIRQSSCASLARSGSDAAILDHALRFGPSRNDKRGPSRDADSKAPAAERNRVEQSITCRDLGAEALRRGIEARGKSARLRAG